MLKGEESDVLTLLRAYLPSAALGAALELGLFWRLSEGPLPLEALAQEWDIPPRRCHIWLELLTSLGLLEHQPGGYLLSAKARREIVETYSQDAWETMAMEARERYPAGEDLALHMATPGSIWEALGRASPDYVEQMAADPARARRFVRLWHELREPLADEIARLLDLRGVERVLDLGGGSGVVSLALLQSRPGLSAVVIDIENVCAAGREIATRSPLGDRISYHPADIVHDDLPGGFDLVIECKVGVYDLELFQKVARALNGGGRFILVDELPREGEAPPIDHLRYAFQNSLRDPGFALPALEQVSRLLEAAGFELISERVLQAGGRLLETRKSRTRYSS
jgi:SAM-dependent methyltransferase